MVDAIDVVGNEALVRDTISAYWRAGVDVPLIFPLTWGAAGPDTLESTLRAAIVASAEHSVVGAGPWGGLPLSASAP
jgi:hypothetical protein